MNTSDIKGRTFLKVAIPLFLFLTLFTIDAHAAINNSGVLDSVLLRFQGAASSWGTYITKRATWLFWTLVVISMVWQFGMMALRKADLAEFFGEFIKFTITIGFFFWLLLNAPTFATAIINGLRTIAGTAAGTDPSLSPSGIVDVGFDIFIKIAKNTSAWSPIDSAFGLLISTIILMVLALVGINMLLLLITAWILTYAGILFLGFGGAEWTRDMAISYYKNVLGLAAQLMTMVFIVGIGQSFVDQYYVAMSKGLDLSELAVMLVVATVLLVLVEKVPPVIGALAGGSLQSLGGGYGAGTAMGAAAIGLGAGALAASAIGSAAANVAGGSQAIKAAFDVAGAEGADGMMEDSLPGSDSSGSIADSFGGDGDEVSFMDEGESSDIPSSNSGGFGDEGGGGEDPAFMDEGESSDIPSSSSGGFGEESPSTSGNGDDLAFMNGESSDTPDALRKGTKEEGAAGTNDVGFMGEGQNNDTPSATSGSDNENPEEGPEKEKGSLGARLIRTGSILAMGVKDAAAVKVGDIKESAQEVIGETAGGKVASAIKDRAEAEAEGTLEPAPAGSSDVAPPSPVSEEVSNFANRD